MSEYFGKDLSEQTVPQERLDHEKKIATQFGIAKTLLKQKKYKEALRKFRWVFSNSLETDCFPTDREIRSLAKNYAPAAAVIRRWRNDKERLIVAQEADSDVIRQWMTLNESLGENLHTIDVFHKLQAADANHHILDSILWRIWEKLVRTGQYEALRSFLPTLGWMLLLHIAEYDIEVWFPRGRDWTTVQIEEEITRKKQEIGEEGPLIFEVAIALAESSIADEFAKRLLVFEHSDLMYAKLIKSAVRARAYSTAEMLFEDAKKSLSKGQWNNSSKAIAAIPSSKKRKN